MTKDVFINTINLTEIKINLITKEVINLQKHERLFQEFNNTLDAMMQKINDEAMNAKQVGDQTSFVHGQIKKNVVDIFQKMYKVSYNNVYVKPQIPDLVKIIEQHDSREEQFFATYLSFFNKIPTPWKEKAEKDQKFGKIEECKKEQSKLQIADEIKELFVTNYKKVYGDE